MEEFFTRRKVVATALCTALAVSGLSMGSTAVMADDNVKITILNAKDELQTQWEELAEEYEKTTGVEVEVSVTVGDSPSEDITKRYASGEVPTIFMGDVQDILMLDEYAMDLSDEEWADIGGTKFGCVVNDKLKGFPFCILKIFAFSKDYENIQKEKEELKGRTDIHVTSSAPWNVEITSPAAEKSQMVKRIIDENAISSEEVMVFGDGVNDACLFRAFCHSRAVANAVPQIIDMAEKVVADCEENGVAREVAEMFSISLQEVLKVQKEENKKDMRGV